MTALSRESSTNTGTAHLGGEFACTSTRVPLQKCQVLTALTLLKVACAKDFLYVARVLSFIPCNAVKAFYRFLL